MSDSGAEMRCMRRSRTCRKLESVLLLMLFFTIFYLLYTVLRSDHATVLSWFGVKVHTEPLPPRQRITSSMTSEEFKRHRQKQGPDSQAGLFVDSYHRKHLHDDVKDNMIIAVGSAITSKSVKHLTQETVGQVSPFLRTFLPSMCKTIGGNDSYIFRIYLAYDYNDSFFSNSTARRAFRNQLHEIRKVLCPAEADISLYFVRCFYEGRPAWSQNDALMTAYLDGADYFYRVNDDTSLTSAGWLPLLLSALHKFHPPEVGVVGPAHLGGNEMILSHDFVHKTHFDIFGFYYPRTFPDWWADDWISSVYGNGRTRKVLTVQVIHTGEKGTRYNHSWIPPEVLRKRLVGDRETLDRYLRWRLSDQAPFSFPKGKKVISMSLYGTNEKYTLGAVRNAQLTPVIFPGWVLRVYVEKIRTDGRTTFPAVPNPVIDKLKSLGAEIAYVDTTIVEAPPMMWRFLVADDERVDVFIVRDADSRLSDRDAEIVAEWLESGRAFHCVRDHPSHRSSPLFGGLIGGRPQELRTVVSERWQALMHTYKDEYGMDMVFLANTIWPRVRQYSLCHDSVSCRNWPNTWPFPTPRRGTDHVGQVFDAYGEPRSIDIDLIKLYPEPWECTLREGESRQSWLLKQEAHKARTKTAERVARRGESLADSQRAIREDKKLQEETKLPSLTGRVVMWSMDYDVRYIQDLKELLGSRGVKFIDKSLALDCRKSGVCPHNLSVITPQNGMEAGQDLAEAFYDTYKNDPEMKRVTHFICFRPVAMCELYIKFKKSIIIVATRRYEEGRLTAERWRDLNMHLTTIQGDHKNIVAASNHYDVEYMRFFTGFDPEYLPYYGMPPSDVSTEGSSRREFLVAAISDPRFRQWFMASVRSALVKLKANVTVVYVGDLYPEGYNLSVLASHPGIIYVPQMVSDPVVSEQYRMNIPLFFPSLELLCLWQKKFKILRNRTLNEQRLLYHGISIDGSPILPTTRGRFDPNQTSSQVALRYWLRFTDILQFPYVGHFSSFEELVEMIQSTNCRMISLKMKHFNQRFRMEIISKWINLINRTL